MFKIFETVVLVQELTKTCLPEKILVASGSNQLRRWFSQDDEMYFDKTKTKIFTKTNTETITKTHTNIEMSSGEGGFEDNEIYKQCGMIAMIIAALQPLQCIGVALMSILFSFHCSCIRIRLTTVRHVTIYASMLF